MLLRGPVGRQLAVERFSGTAADLSWRSRLAQDKLPSKALRYLDVPKVGQRWEEMTGAAARCDAPAFAGVCQECRGCKA
jgi:hypothetical protein